ncbi:MAG TPA: lipopolysaccharide biosynthesis protein, partial [Thermoanaerobaculia bacterium]|nr:lipopolysaccharide biosynthesis protein [Thermoanaerobaculia bacterium]
MKDRIAHSVFWMFWSRGGVQSLAFLATLFVARLLSPGDYGLMAIASIWIGAIELLAEMGLGAAVVQFRDLNEDELNACFWVTMTIACAGYGTLFVAAPAIREWFSAPAMLVPVLRAAGLTLPITAFRVVPDGLLRKELKLDKISQAEIAGSLATMPVTVGLAATGAGVWALVGGALTLPVVQTAVTFVFARWRPAFRVNSPRFSAIVHYSIASLGTRIGWSLLGQTDELVLGKVGGHIVLGFYSMAMRLALLPVSKITVVANQLVVPIMAELQSDVRRMRNSFLRGLRMVACLTVPLCVGTALVAPDLIPTMLTAKWTPIVPILQILAAFALARSIGALLPPVYYARYRVTSLLRWTTGQLIVMPIVFLIGAWRWGAYGVAAGWALVYPVVMALMMREVIHELEITWKEIWDQVRPLVIAVAVM